MENFFWYSKTFFALILFYAEKERQPRAGNCQFSNSSFMKKSVFGTIWRHNKTMNKFYCGERRREQSESYEKQNCLKMHKLTFSICRKPTNRHKLGYFFCCFATHMHTKTPKCDDEKDKSCFTQKSGEHLCVDFFRLVNY